MSPDEQAALSRAHSDEAIILLPLPSGNWAVMNRGFELCAIINLFYTARTETLAVWLEQLKALWYKPPPTPNFSSKPKPTLEDLGL